MMEELRHLPSMTPGVRGAENVLWARLLRGRRPWGQGGNPNPWERAPRIPLGLREPWWHLSQVQAVGTELSFPLCLLSPRGSLSAWGFLSSGSGRGAESALRQRLRDLQSEHSPGDGSQRDAKCLHPKTASGNSDQDPSSSPGVQIDQ